ncbi:hypothetical protein [Streptomyces tendae]|nr:hypothetical protein [Streptomyces tendae]
MTVNRDVVLTDGGSDLKTVIMAASPGSHDGTKLRLAAIAGRHAHH